MNREDRRRVKKKAEHIWTLEKQIESAKSENKSSLMQELQDYTKKLDLSDMILIDEYIIEYCAEES
jgi:hypothetical protein